MRGGNNGLQFREGLSWGLMEQERESTLVLLDLGLYVMKKFK